LIKTLNFKQKEVNNKEIRCKKCHQSKSEVGKKGEVMSLVKFEVSAPTEMASVLTAKSVEAMGLKTDDEIQLIFKAIHILPVKE